MVVASLAVGCMPVGSAGSSSSSGDSAAVNTTRNALIDWGSCPSPDGSRCTSMNFSQALNFSAARAEFERACAAQHDGDVSVYSDGKCDLGSNVGVCKDARLDELPNEEQLPVEVVWYDESCQIALDPTVTCRVELQGNFDFARCEMDIP